MKRQGLSDRAIARRLGIDRRTVKKYIETGEFPSYKAVDRKSGLEPYYELIKGWLSQEDYQATKLYEKVLFQGYQGSYTTVKRYVRGLKEERGRVAYVRFETAPGLQSQVDFGDFKVICEDGQELTLYAFIMVLGFSRHMYVEFVKLCTMPVFLECHMNAFGYFHGVPGEILYDNMKNVVVRRHVGGVKFNDTMLDFGSHYRFKAQATPAYSPWYKGKVERPIQYIREGFWRGYKYIDLITLNRDIKVWLNDVAYNRVHGTTRQKVSERFEIERSHLGEIPGRPYDTSEKVTRKVYKDCQVAFDGNRYVAPHKYVGKKVILKVKNGMIRIYHDEEPLAAYRIPEGKGQMVAHPWFYKDLIEDMEQAKKKYRVPYGKAKATIGLLRHGLKYETVQRRDLSDYDELVGGAHA
jgi:transposase